MFFTRKRPNRNKSIPYKKLVIDNHKAVYFEIPKVACTTINFLLIRMFIRAGEKFVVQQVHTDENLPRIWGELEGKYLGYFRFAFVRHPLTRIQSCFLDKVKPPGYHVAGAFKNGLYEPFQRFGDSFWPGMSFDDFVDSVSNIDDAQADPHFRSQNCFVTNSDDELTLDFVGKFENLESDLISLLRRFGVTGTIQIPVVNKQQRPDNWRLNERTKQLIFERYRRDFEMFGYDLPVA